MCRSSLEALVRVAVEQVEDAEHLPLRRDRDRGDHAEAGLAAVGQRDRDRRLPAAERVDGRGAPRDRLAAGALVAVQAVLLLGELRRSGLRGRTGAACRLRARRAAPRRRRRRWRRAAG